MSARDEMELNRLACDACGTKHQCALMGPDACPKDDFDDGLRPALFADDALDIEEDHRNKVAEHAAQMKARNANRLTARR